LVPLCPSVYGRERDRRLAKAAERLISKDVLCDESEEGELWSIEIAERFECTLLPE
jgi:hypothetical protein